MHKGTASSQTPDGLLCARHPLALGVIRAGPEEDWVLKTQMVSKLGNIALTRATREASEEEESGERYRRQSQMFPREEDDPGERAVMVRM